MRRAGHVAVALCTLLALTACTSAGGDGLPTASSDEFEDLPLIVAHAKELASAAGDATPTVAIVKSSLAEVFDHGVSEDPERNREMYFVRMDGDFQDCPMCSHQIGASFGPTRWMSFDWDPQQDGGLDFGYGSAPHLEEFGEVYAVELG